MIIQPDSIQACLLFGQTNKYNGEGRQLILKIRLDWN